MQTTRYFTEQVLRKRPYVDPNWCMVIVSNPLRSQVQEDGRIRFWGEVLDPRDGQVRVLRVVTLEDAVTVHNAFFDRGFRRDTQ